MFSIIFLVAAILYITLLHKTPFKGDFIIKAIPALSLAAMAALFIPGIEGKLLIAGFVLSALGDISLSFEGEKYFLGGLVFFLLAHVIYIITFAQNRAYGSGDIPILAALAIFGIVMTIVLFPKLGDMRIPVYIYISVIITMGVFAAIWGGPKPVFLILGAVIFMLSDSMIAIDKFLTPVPGAKYIIMTTYYAGQFLICYSFLPMRFNALP